MTVPKSKSEGILSPALDELNITGNDPLSWTPPAVMAAEAADKRKSLFKTIAAGFGAAAVVVLGLFAFNRRR